MGLVAKRSVLFIDSNVLAALALQEPPAVDFVAKMKRDGGDLYLAPAVVVEIAKARGGVQRELIKAANDHCIGFSTVPRDELLNEELLAAIAGRPAPSIKFLEIAALREAVLATYSTNSGKPPLYSKADLNDVLAGLADLPTFATFKEFFKAHSPLFSRALVNNAPAHVQRAVRDRDRSIPIAGHDKRGLAYFIAMLMANAYRRGKNVGKGAGSITDIPMVIEVARFDGLLTRDKDLIACAILTTEVLDEDGLRVIQVP